MSITEKALWILERNSTQRLTLESVAASCGVSRSHLANAFGTSTGWPVMRYLKARRLTAAAYRLADGARDILSLALETGYESHAAFTRAFRDHFGCTPEMVRNQGSVDGLTTTPPLDRSARRTSLPLPQLSRLGRLKLVGLAAPCSFNEIVHIPAQWHQFVSDFYDDIPNKVEAMPVGMCEAPDEEGSFRYVCAAMVEEVRDRVPGLTYVETEPCEYAVFQHGGHVSAIFDTYGAIWNEALPALSRTAANGPVLEFHNDAFDPDTGLGGLEIWVPLLDINHTPSAAVRDSGR